MADNPRMLIGKEIPLKDAGRDVLGEALASSNQAKGINASRLPENQPGYQPEKQIKWGDYSEMPAYRYTDK